MPDIALSPPPAVRVRLHITPFNPQLLDKILGPSAQASASNISFHSVQTFPERGFGYVELPAMEAQKLKKKLHGSTLKGAKVRIEDAQPEKKRKSDIEEDDGERKARRTERKARKQAEDGVLPGLELEEGRRVKRGWAEKNDRSNKKSKRATEETSSGLEGKKLRFKTNMSPTSTTGVTDAKDPSKQKKKSSKGSKKRLVVEEFSNNSKPIGNEIETESSAAQSMGYEEGKGWVNEAGNVIDPGPRSSRRKATESRPKGERRISAVESRETGEVPVAQEPIESNAPSDSESVDGDTPSEQPKEMHPLEALFKRPAPKESEIAKPRPKPIDTSFSFFDAPNAAEDEEMGADMPPQTPHTKRDLEWRSIRSAAPTPDTAAIGRKFSFPSSGDSDEEQDEDEAPAMPEAGRDVEMHDSEQAEPITATDSAHEKGEESAFRKWFYDNRGDLNRGWKKRRRDEKKVQRQRENRRLSRKIA